ncbi:GrpB family protein [Latilactobacillus curvatus]
MLKSIKTFSNNVVTLFVEKEIGGLLLFIRVVPYDPFWEVEYENESQKISNILKDILVEIYHIGSTAVKGLHAKPIIDIMPVVTNISLVDKHNEEFVASGYECMGEFGIKGRRYFRKGGDNRTHQIHIFEQNSHKNITRHIAVRNFLRTHPDIALEYGKLKMKLANRFPEDIEGYCAGKDAFVKQLEKDALLWYQNNKSYKTQ